MKYPDGSPINVGDLVWWNEGSCVGYVQVIAESEAEYVGWGLDSPHVFLSNIHPFSPGSNIGVAYPEACLKDEGVAPLIGEDRIRLDRASHRRPVCSQPPLTTPKTQSRLKSKIASSLDGYSRFGRMTKHCKQSRRDEPGNFRPRMDTDKHGWGETAEDMNDAN